MGPFILRLRGGVNREGCSECTEMSGVTLWQWQSAHGSKVSWEAILLKFALREVRAASGCDSFKDDE